jgi:hypothetical protein
VTCLDSSQRMLAVAKECLAVENFCDRSVEFICADWAEWSGGGGPFDLVATHFFLDCFRADQLARLVSKTAALTSPGAMWVLSDFREPTAGWQRVRARVLLKLAYLSFRWITRLPGTRLIPPEPFLTAHGFERIHQRIFHHGLLYAGLWRANRAQPEQ